MKDLPSRQDKSFSQKDELQQIAVWQLLYQVQHLGRYISRLQTIWGRNSARWLIRKDRGASCQCQIPEPGMEAGKPILPRTKIQPNSKVAMTRRVSALEAFRHNPTDGSFAPSAYRPRTCTKCPNLLFLSYQAGLLSQLQVISRVKLTCLTTV